MNRLRHGLITGRKTQVACFIAAQLALPTGMITAAEAQDVFNPALLELGTSSRSAVDLSAFNEEGGQIPGTYRVDIFLNNDKVETRDVGFFLSAGADGKKRLVPCLSVDDLTRYGVLTSKFPGLTQPGQSCADFTAIAQAESHFLFNKQQLLLSFPQNAVSSTARGWIDPASWDEGITALMLNYSASGARNWAKSGSGNDSDNQYLNLCPGLNIGAWRLRNYTTWNRTRDGGPDGQIQSDWDTVYTYAQRNIRSLNSQLTLGDSSTPADVFESVPFRGAQLASDDEMLPESLRGYAPVVRGIARTNAQVIIRQNGYIIYERAVSPGPFDITDMYPTGGSGDLYVTIKESDGSEQTLVVPFASLPVLQREGQLKYALTAATYRSYDHSVDQRAFGQSTFIYGLPAGFTFYGGGQTANHYASLAAGVGKNLGQVGALSIDVTQAWSQMKDTSRENGRAFRARFSKNVADTGTQIAIAGYRYATDGYRDLSQVLDTWRDGEAQAYSLDSRRNRAELTVNQSLWENAGSLALSVVREDYWSSSRKMESWGVSYNNSLGSVSYSLNYTYSQRASNGVWAGQNGRIYDSDHLFALSISMPLSLLFGEHHAYASYMLNTSKSGNTSHQVALNGSALEDNNLNWSAMQGYGSQGEGNSGGVTADWRATYGELNGGYNYDRYGERLNYGVAGSIVAHEDGVTFGQQLGETVAIVAAPGAQGVKVQGQNGVKTDVWGYALVPYASPYRKNDVMLDTETFSDDTDVAITSSTVVPTRGAIAKARYQTSVGRRVLMTLTLTTGQPVPFGAMVTTDNRHSSQGFIVGDHGQVYLTGLSDHGRLQVRWGNNAAGQCSVDYRLTEKTDGITRLNKTCQ